MTRSATDQARVGILAVGSYLPPTIRGNDWWPAEIVDGWMRQRAAAKSAPPAAKTAGEARVIAEIAAQAGDPFQGSRLRHVMTDDTTSYDLESAAAEQALSRASIARDAIDLVLTHTTVPEYLLSNSACVLHERLGLPPSCLSIQVDGAAYSFLGQLALAEGMIASGRARHALLVQSSGVSRLISSEDPVSPLFGDGASAVVVGPVDRDRGILSSVHRTEGRYPRTLIASVPGGRWYDRGPITMHSADGAQAREVFVGIVDRAKGVIDEALAGAGVRADEIDVFATHQGTSWLRGAVQEHAGLTRARSVEVFARTGNLFSVMIPLGLEDAAPGELVLMFGGGTGQTFGATVVRR